MIAYNYSIRGKSHVAKGTVCQDDSRYVRLASGWYLGIVADGVGSAKHSDVGSHTAVKALEKYCGKHITRGMAEGQLLQVLQEGYDYAMQMIVQTVAEQNGDLSEYDTTLSCALYDGKRVVYGHAGDGGILVRDSSGETRMITKRQKGSDGMTVVPLRGGAHYWDFGVYRNEATAVLLATDGMLDGFFQPNFINLPPNLEAAYKGDYPRDNVYISASEFFMNPEGVYFNPRVSSHADALIRHFLEGELDEKDQGIYRDCLYYMYSKMLGEKYAEAICKGFEKYYYSVWALSQVSDDKSVVCLINEKAVIKAADVKYYQEPNWKWRQEAHNAILYNKDIPPTPYDDPMSIEPIDIYGDRLFSDDRKKLSNEDRLIDSLDDGGEEGKRSKKIQKTPYGYLVVMAAVCLLVGGVVGMIAGGKFFGSTSKNNYTSGMKTSIPFQNDADPSPTPAAGTAIADADVSWETVAESWKDLKEIKESSNELMDFLQKNPLEGKSGLESALPPNCTEILAILEEFRADAEGELDESGGVVSPTPVNSTDPTGSPDVIEGYTTLKKKKQEELKETLNRCEQAVDDAGNIDKNNHSELDNELKETNAPDGIDSLSKSQKLEFYLECLKTKYEKKDVDQKKKIYDGICSLLDAQQETAEE